MKGSGAGFLAFCREEAAQESCALGFLQALVDLGRMVALGVGENAGALVDTARLGIRGAEVEAIDAGGGDGCGAGGARFQRNPEVAAGQPFRAQGLAGGADGEDFCVGGRIMQFTGAVSGTGDDFPVARDYGPHGDFAAGAGGLCLGQGGVHE